MSVDLSKVWLVRGSGGEGGGCVMEWTALFAGFSKSDQPPCTHSSVAAMFIWANDELPDDERQRLVRFIPRLAACRAPRDRARSLGVMTRLHAWEDRTAMPDLDDTDAVIAWLDEFLDTYDKAMAEEGALYEPDPADATHQT